MLIGYARCSTDAQDLTAQRDALIALGVTPERIYVDHGLTGTNRDRPGSREALAACRLRGKQPKLTLKQEAHLVALHKAGEHTTAELAELFSIGRSTVYRALGRAQARTTA
jgi:DNA invertase Pin-like site-specific DNA recombinase